MSSATSTVRVRQTTTANTSSAAIVVINTGYLKTKLGILKLAILILSLVIFVLLVIDSPHSHYGRHSYVGDFFLLLINFAHLYTIGLMVVTCLLSLSTASLLPKMSLDFVFHFFAFVLYMVGGIWVLTGAINERPNSIVAASVMALIVAVLHLIHGVFSYRLCAVH